MNREIKFRAWDGQKITNIENIEFSTEGIVATKDDGYFGYVGSDIILMQFTGLYDKHNKPIYEGDIINVNDIYYGISFVGVVSFRDGSFVVKNDMWLDCEVEVIGNIYENPNLLD